MITVQEAFRRFFLAKGDFGDYRCNKIKFVTADKKRGTGGEIITLQKARLLGQYKPLKSEEPKKSRRNPWRDFYDEDTARHYRIHIDLILSVNEIQIA